MKELATAIGLVYTKLVLFIKLQLPKAVQYFRRLFLMFPDLLFILQLI
jgi:hypothetical protein